MGIRNRAIDDIENQHPLDRIELNAFMAGSVRAGRLWLCVERRAEIISPPAAIDLQGGNLRGQIVPVSFYEQILEFRNQMQELLQRPA